MNVPKEKNAYVACLDILGVRRALREFGATALAGKYAQAVDMARERREAQHTFLKAGITTMAQAEALGEEAVAFKTQWFTAIEHVTIFSDSLFAFTVDDSPHSLVNLCEFTNTVWRMFYYQDLPMRGTIACGTTLVDTSRSLYIGTAIVDAFLLQEDISVMGVVLKDGLEPDTASATRILDVPTKGGHILPLRVPVNGQDGRLVLKDEVVAPFKRMRTAAGESQAERYAKSVPIVATMLNLEESDLY